MILVDVDGVVADFASEVMGKAKSEGCRQIEVYGSDITKWYHRDDRVALARIISEVNPAWLWAIEGALDGIDELLNLGPVRFVTTAMEDHVNWCYMRELWLRRRFPRGGRPIFTSDKHLILGDLFIDDRLDLCEAWSKQHNKRSLLMSQPYNEHEKPSSNLVHRVHSWAEIVEQAQKVAQTIF